MKITSKVAICNECGMEWIKPFWEPKWLSRIGAADAHLLYHDTALKDQEQPEKHPLVIAWREWERERIIALLEEKLSEDYNGNCFMSVVRVIALIKGEN
jgi:hypothetical protein